MSVLENLPEDIRSMIPVLSQFIPEYQMAVIALCATKGDEKQFFQDKMREMYARWMSIPKTGDTEGEGNNALAYLHYFIGSNDWWITEKDMLEQQHQAFGVASLEMGGCIPEYGYISLVEFNRVSGIELDLHWQAKPLYEAVPSLSF